MLKIKLLIAVNRAIYTTHITIDHGLGLPMAYRIFHVHGGKMDAKNDNGFSVLIELPGK